MPTAYINKVADEQGTSVSNIESKWKQAKKQAKKQGKGSNYAYVTAIFKKMVGESTKSTFSQFLSS
jgi:hypothetical protein